MTTQTTVKTSEHYETIKLGIDAHAKWYYVSRQVDGATPQPVQKMTFEELRLFVARNLVLRPPHRGRVERGRASGSEGVCSSLWAFGG